MRTENGLPVRGIRGWNKGAARRSSRRGVAQRLLRGAIEIAGIMDDARRGLDPARRHALRRPRTAFDSTVELAFSR